MKLSEYISTNYKSQTEFAIANNIKPQQVTQWLSNGFIVVDGALYSQRRVLATPPVTSIVAVGVTDTGTIHVIAD